MHSKPGAAIRAEQLRSTAIFKSQEVQYLFKKCASKSHFNLNIVVMQGHIVLHRLKKTSLITTSIILKGFPTENYAGESSHDSLS